MIAMALAVNECGDKIKKINVNKYVNVKVNK